MKNTYSGKSINKAGEILIDEKIKTGTPDFEAAMDVLTYWRLMHEAPLANAQRIVQVEASKIDKTAFTAKRLKRYESIVSKLRRFDDMKLKNMQDIGGCRVVVSTLKKLNQLIRTLKRRPEFKNRQGVIRYKDYIETPKEDGYRSYHLIGRFKDISNSDRNIEVQLRTRLQHDWATALEIVDIFTKQKLKSNQGEKKWSEFFKTVSEQFSIMEKTANFNVNKRTTWNSYLNNVLSNEEALKSCRTAKRLIKEIDVAKKFQAFAHSLKFADGELEKIKKERDGFILITIDLAKYMISLEFFDQNNIENAVQKYSECEKESAGRKDFVTVLVSTTAVDGIKAAYPNYFADSTEFFKHLLLISSAPIEKEQTTPIGKIGDILTEALVRIIKYLPKNKN